MRPSRLFAGSIAVAIALCGLTASSAPKKRAAAPADWQQQYDLCLQYTAQSALEVCERALKSIPPATPDEEISQLHLYKGLALAELGRDDQALNAFAHAVTFDRNNAKAYYNYGVACERMGKQRKAYDAYQTAWELDPYQYPKPDDPATTGDIPFENEHEVVLRASPQIGYLQNTGSYLNVEKFVYLSADAGVDVQIWKRWFGTVNFLYAHSKWTGAYGGSGMDIYGPSVGIRYVHWDNEMQMPDLHTIFDRSRYWFELAVGPYITSIGGQTFDPAQPFVRGRTDVDIGVNFGAGFDHYFNDHFGVGLQAKFHYVNFAENYILITFGPHFLGRF